MTTELGILAADTLMGMFSPEPRHPDYRGGIVAAGCEIPAYTFGNGNLVHRDEIDTLISKGMYTFNWYYRNGSDEPTAEPVDGTEGPRFGAHNQHDVWWKVLDPVEFVCHAETGL